MTALPTCPLCSARSEPLASVADHFFGSAGVWEYRRCTASGCGVAFPFPAPTDEQLEAAYSTYYTHEDGGSASLPGRIEAAFAAIARAPSSRWRRLPVAGWFAEQIGWELGGLRPSSGTVVDVGCGDGARLTRLRRAGWSRAIGIEPDPAAVKVGLEHGLDVRPGTAEAIPLDDGAVEAVLMHHVIEHVRDPRRALGEAFRVLAKGGELALVTPNIDSAGRERWGAHWRGFEAPRHLTIFTLAALRTLAQDSGFKVICSRTSARSAAWVDDVSARAAGTERAAAGLAARIRRADRAFRAHAATKPQERGEEIVFIARKG